MRTDVDTRDEFTKTETSYTNEADDGIMYIILFVVPRKSTFIVQKTMFRATYSNVLFETYALDDQIDGEEYDLCASFVSGNLLKEKMTKIATSFNIQIWELGQNDSQVEE